MPHASTAALSKPSRKTQATDGDYMMSLAPLFDFMARGGPALWVIAALSVLTLALLFWRVIGLAQAGVWGRRVRRSCR